MERHQHQQLIAQQAAASDDSPPSRPEDVSRVCADKTASAAPGDRYRQWRVCLENYRPKGISLPLGEFKSPATGWLVISGRRGHYDFCDATGAYGLASGAAFYYESCSGLALTKGGGVDRAATDNARVERVRTGRVSIDNLREAVWMLLFRGEASELQTSIESYAVPQGIAPHLTIPKQWERPSSSSSMSMNSGQTMLTWRWIPAAGDSYAGSLTWPDSYDAAESHAAALLAVAEQGLIEGCAQGDLPAPSVFAASKQHELNELYRDALRNLDRDVRAAAGKWKSLPPCRK